MLTGALKPLSFGGGGGGIFLACHDTTLLPSDKYTRNIVSMGFLPWEIGVAFPGESQLQQSSYPTYCACWVFLVFPKSTKSDMDYRIFKMHTDVNVCDCT